MWVWEIGVRDSGCSQGAKAFLGKKALAQVAAEEHNIGALIIRIGIWGPLSYNSNKEPPK